MEGFVSSFVGFLLVLAYLLLVITAIYSLAALIYPFGQLKTRKEAAQCLGGTLIMFVIVSVAVALNVDEMPTRPEDIAADEWNRRLEVCRSGDAKLQECMFNTTVIAQLENDKKRGRTENAEEAKSKRREEIAATTPQAKAPSSAPRPAAPIRGNWVYTQEKDAMRSTITHFAQIRSQNSLQFGFPYRGGSRGTLYVRDTAGELDIALGIERGQFQCNRFANEKIAVKFDDGGVQEFACREDSNGSANFIFIAPEAEFLEKLKETSVVVIEAAFFQEGRRQLTFHTLGLKWEYNQPSGG
jgi:hypothetical protein